MVGVAKHVRIRGTDCLLLDLAKAINCCIGRKLVGPLVPLHQLVLFFSCSNLLTVILMMLFNAVVINTRNVLLMLQANCVY